MLNDALISDCCLNLWGNYIVLTTDCGVGKCIIFAFQRNECEMFLMVFRDCFKILQIFDQILM